MPKFLIVTISFLIFILLSAKSQTVIIDSLRIALLKNDFEQKEAIVLKICEQHGSLAADSVLKYTSLGLKMCAKYSDNYYKFKNIYVNYYFKNSKIKEANLHLDSLISELAKGKVKPSTVHEILMSKLSALIRENKYKIATDSAFNLLKRGELHKDTLSILKTYSMLGLINMELQQDIEALKWYYMGVSYTKNKVLNQQVSALFANMGSCHRIQKNIDSSLLYLNKSIEYARLSQNLSIEANALNIRAQLYYDQNKIELAKKDLEYAGNLRRKVGDPLYLIGDLGVLSKFYANIGQTDKAIAFANEGLAIAQKYNNTNKILFIHTCLAHAYTKAYNYKKAYNEALIVMNLNDSLSEANNLNDLAELQTNYEFQKKENLILNQKNKITNTRNLAIGSTLLFVLSSLVFWLSYKNYKHQQNKKLENAVAEGEIKSLRAIQNAQETERKRIAADLHDNLGAYAAAMSANIKYLKEDTHIENKQLIYQLEKNAHQMVMNLEDSIWVLKNSELSFVSLIDKFKSWTLRIMKNYPDIKYTYKEHIEKDNELSPVKILNLFNILKESLTNALKHSNCTEIMITIKSIENMYISIVDNGKGIDTKLSNVGNGIENVKKRAKEFNIQVAWEKASPRGTSVIIECATSI